MVAMSLGRTHSPCLQLESARPFVPKRVLRTDCLKAHDAPAASQVTDMVPERPLMVSARSMFPPPQKVVPGMQVHLWNEPRSDICASRSEPR